MSMPYRAIHKNSWASITHTCPYAATLGPLKRFTESAKGQSQHRVLPSARRFKPALLPEFRGRGNKISKNLSHPYTPAIRLQGLHFQCTTWAKHVGDLFSSSVVAAPATTIEEHVLVRQQMQDPTRGDVARKRRSDNGQRAKWFSCLVNKCVVMRT